MANAAVARVQWTPVLITPYGRWLYFEGELEFRPAGQRRPTFHVWLPESHNNPHAAYVKAVRYAHRAVAGDALKLQSTEPAKENHR